MNFGFIGAGNMAGAIIKGMIKSNVSEENIFAYDVNENVFKCLGNINKVSTIKNLFETCETIVLAVKPNILATVLDEIKNYDISNKLIISIAAGKDLTFLTSYLEKTAVIRVMPNINAKVLCATSGYCYNEFVNGSHKETVEEMFSSIGTIIEIEEKFFSIFGVLAGSSPAFAYLYIDSLARAAQKAGMSRKDALKITAQTVLGSAKMILEDDTHPIDLVDQVCSPAGTTIEGIASLKSDNFESAIINAFDKTLEKDSIIAKLTK